MVFNYLITQQKHYNDNIYDLKYFTDMLSKLNCPYCFIIHDKETDIHYHALVLGCCFKKIEILDFFNTADITIIDNIIGSFDYLTHKNNIEKNIYSVYDIIYSSCSYDFIVNYSNLATNRKKSKDNVLVEIVNNITSHIFTCIQDCLDYDTFVTTKNYYVLCDLIQRFNFIEVDL